MTNVDEPLIKSRVAFLGPSGSYTSQVATDRFGNTAECLDKATIGDVIEAVASKSVEFGVVPVENSTMGNVDATFDALLKLAAEYPGSVQIIAEQYLPIHHCLLSKESSKSKIKRVYSHIQSLGQTASWCAVHLKGVERIAVPSNSAAAQLASKELGAAAIAGELCADLYSLNLLERNIEDMKNNTTRFLIFGNHTGRRDEQRNKTILGLTIDNRQSGSLTAAFQALEKNGIDLIKVDSRPSKVALWNYFFFVEVVGHIEDCNVREALAELQTICQSIIVFGSFADVRQLQ